MNSTAEWASIRNARCRDCGVAASSSDRFRVQLQSQNHCSQSRLVSRSVGGIRSGVKDEIEAGFCCYAGVSTVTG